MGINPAHFGNAPIPRTHFKKLPGTRIDDRVRLSNHLPGLSMERAI